MSVFFFGMGYSSRATANAIRSIIDQNITIFGTTRSRARAEELLRDKIRSHAFDGRAPGLMLASDLKKSTHVIASIPPTNGSDPVLEHHQQELDEAQDLQWLAYFSSVGVYAGSDGGWIDESAALARENERAAERIGVEERWIEYAEKRDVPLAIFRIAGIYGPGRSAINKLKDGLAHRIIKPGQVFNRVHRDDIGRITALAMQNRLSGIFNLTDDEPAPPQDLVTYGAKLLKVQPPKSVPFEKSDLSEMAKMFYSDNKRVSNAKIKKALGIELLYPTYREGLQMIHELDN